MEELAQKLGISRMSLHHWAHSGIKKIKDKERFDKVVKELEKT